MHVHKSAYNRHSNRVWPVFRPHILVEGSGLVYIRTLTCAVAIWCIHSLATASEWALRVKSVETTWYSLSTMTLKEPGSVEWTASKLILYG